MADPICKRCGGPVVYIGISGAAPPVCKNDCAGRCPKCLTTEIEPFVLYGYIGPFMLPTMKSVMHCIPNGHVWEEK